MKLGAVVLAAGASRRLGQPKQWVEHAGEALVRRAARLACSVSEDVVVVVPADAAPFHDALKDLSVRVVPNAWAEEGMAASLRIGTASLGRVDGALLLSVDQWKVTEALLGQLRNAFITDSSRAVASAYAGTLGIPAVLPASAFASIQLLKGDHGAKALLAHATTIAFEDGRFDLDDPDDLEALRQKP
jgi:molybdenum cofactor cytidylyltransferase